MFANLVIISGIDLEMRTPAGSTPLHTACEFGNIDVVKSLLQKSTIEVDIYKKNNYQETAEDLARLYGHTDIVKLLEFTTLQKKIEEQEKKLALDKARLETLRLKYSNEAENPENHKNIFEMFDYVLDLLGLFWKLCWKKIRKKYEKKIKRKLKKTGHKGE